MPDNSVPMEMMHKKDVMKTAPHKDDSEGKDGSSTDEWDPWNPPCPPRAPPPPVNNLFVHIKLAEEWMAITGAILAKSRATNIIIPDRTPQWVNYALFDTLTRLAPILKKDSYRSFLRLFDQNGRGMRWGYVITPETFNQIIVHNALQCAKVALKGQARELNGFRANPNYMTQYGYFPLHKAAELFSVEMIELLLRHGALASVRTAATGVNKGLLPLHVAVENTCLHKYLEEGLFGSQEHQDYSQADMNYIYKLIHLLCLPEMKIFLDTTRLLAKHTDNLFDELWNYIEDGKLAQTAILLLAAQEQIRMEIPYKRNGDGKPDWFAIVTARIADKIATLHCETEACQNIMEQKQLEAKLKTNLATLSLVSIISRAGEALDSYIRAHPKVPIKVSHSEVSERVSLILKEYSCCPNGQRTDIRNLGPYKYVLSKKDLPDKLWEMAGTKASTEMGCLHSAIGKDAIKNEPRGWELKYARRSFFPYWRSVLVSQSLVKVIVMKPMHIDVQDQQRALNKSTGTQSTFVPVPGGIPQLITNHQPRRLFGTMALTLMKVLKNA